MNRKLLMLGLGLNALGVMLNIVAGDATWTFLNVIGFGVCAAVLVLLEESDG